MDLTIPSAEQVRAQLAPLTLKQLERLAELSGVPVTTIYKIKRGDTQNPGMETVRLFLPHVQAAFLGPSAEPDAEPKAAAA